MMARNTIPNKQELDKIIKLAMVGYFTTVGEYFSLNNVLAAQFATVLTESFYNHEVGRQLLRILYRRAKQAYISANGDLKTAGELLAESLLKLTRQATNKTLSNYKKSVKFEHILASYLKEIVQPIIKQKLLLESKKLPTEKTEEAVKNLIEVGTDIVAAGMLLYNSLVQMYKNSVNKAFRATNKIDAGYSNAVGYLNNSDFRELLEYLKGGAFKEMITSIAERLPSTNYSTPRFLPTIQ